MNRTLPFDDSDARHTPFDGSDLGPASPRSVTHPSGRWSPASSGMSWSLSQAVRRTGPSRRKSSLKSPSCGRSTSAAMPARSANETFDAVTAGRVRVGRDVEALAAIWEGQAGKVIGGGCRDHRHGGHHHAQRQHGLGAFAGGHDVDAPPGLKTEARAVTEEATHRASRIGGPRLPVSIRIEPGATHAGNRAVWPVTAAIKAGKAPPRRPYSGNLRIGERCQRGAREVCDLHGQFVHRRLVGGHSHKPAATDRSTAFSRISDISEKKS
jgi:hypothetical protein